MTRSLALDRTAWDLVLDAAGNIAIVSAPYSVAQDVACAIRTFRKDCFYQQGRGLPYFQLILGHRPSVPFLKAQFIRAAMSVKAVVSVKCFLQTHADRSLTGQVQVTDASGTVSVVGVSAANNIFTLDVSVLGGPNVLG